MHSIIKKTPSLYKKNCIGSTQTSEINLYKKTQVLKLIETPALPAKEVTLLATFVNSAPLNLLECLLPAFTGGFSLSESTMDLPLLAQKRKIFWGWFRWESCSPRYSGHLFHQQKSRSLNKKLTFGPKYPNFGVKKAHFCP